MARRKDYIWLLHWCWKSQAHTTSPAVEVHTDHLKKVSWRGVNPWRGRGQKHYFSSTRLWESHVNKDQRLGKGSLKIETGYVWTAQFLMKVFFLCFVLWLRLRNLNKQNSWTLPEARGTFLTKNRLICWERPLQDVEFVCMFRTGIQIKSALEPDYHWAVAISPEKEKNRI